MPYCRNCGTEIDAAARFCMACGTNTLIDQQAPVIQQPVVYVKPKVPGRGFGISAMVVSIVGLVYAFSALSATLEMVGQFGNYRFFDVDMVIGMLIAYLMIASLSIMAIPFALTARKRGYINNVSTSGLVMGVLGTIFWIIQMTTWIAGAIYHA